MQLNIFCLVTVMEHLFYIIQLYRIQFWEAPKQYGMIQYITILYNMIREDKI